MKFDVTTSKLYQQIMDAATSFFGLDKDTATETDIHAAMEGQKPLSDQLDAAKIAAIADVQKQLDDLKSQATDQAKKITDLEKRATDAEAEAGTKDERIKTLQLEIAAAKTEFEAAQKQHKVETDNLAGELAKTKAGKTLELDEGGDGHDASKADKGNGSATVIVAKSQSLSDMLKKRQN